MELVSVIIPVYNIRTYLNQCVQSVCAQSYPHLEIILVDDGSTDDSGMMCDELAIKDPRIKVFHKENGGLSDARNYGLLQATGDYIFYLDGDDWITSSAIENLVKTADNYDADFVQGGFYYAYPEYLLYRKEESSIITFTPKEAMKELIRDGRIKNFAWGNLIRKDLALKVPFPKGKYFEDSFWKYQMIELAEKYVYNPCPGYYYRQRSGSISGDFSIKNFDLLQGVEPRLIYIAGHYKDLYLLALNKYWVLAYNFYHLSEKTGNNDLKNFYCHYLFEKTQNYGSDLNRAMKLNIVSAFMFFSYTYSCDRLYLIVCLVNKLLEKSMPSKYKKECYQ